ncbi:MAG: hypothetical protein IPM47_01990 [Sphingobacteriales bacterium]|nr:MAG: hypothetical protein IPM47_01990 [Sphingobacteriales bacterium]
MEKNPFKQIVENEALPKNHKNKVLNTIDTTKFWFDVIDLFTFKQVQAHTELMQTMLENWNNK